MIDLSQHPNKQWAQKHPIPVAVEFAQADGMCSTLEGEVAYRAGDAIMTGVADERWPIQRDKFDATYEPLTPTSMGQDGDYVKKPIPVLVLELTEPMQVKVGWQADPLQGQVGDWLVQYDAESYGIVSRAIFYQTYRLLNMMNHTFIADRPYDEHKSFIKTELEKIQDGVANHPQGRVLILEDGSFPWSDALSKLSQYERHGLRRFNSDVDDKTAFNTQVAFDAPESERQSVNTMAAQWLVAYSDSITFVWDGGDDTHEGLFMCQLLKMAISARLTISWINPSRKKTWLLTSHKFHDIQLSTLDFLDLSSNDLQEKFIDCSTDCATDCATDWSLQDWEDSINKIRLTSQSIQGEADSLVLNKGLSWLEPLLKKLAPTLVPSKYKPELNLFERMAGYSEKLLFALISLDKKYWIEKKQYKKAVLSYPDGVYYGPFEGTETKDNNTIKKGTETKDNNTIKLDPICRTIKLDTKFQEYDQRSALAGNRQRSAYWWIAIFNLSAVSISLLGAGFEWVFTLMAMSMVALARQLRWSDNWLDSRSIAETIRYTRMLLPLLANCRYQIQPLWVYNYGSADYKHSHFWQARAAIREEGWPKADNSNSTSYRPSQNLEMLKVYVVKCLEDQRNYHIENQKKHKNIKNNIGIITILLGGIATILSVMIYILPLSENDLRNAVTLLPAIIGMLQGIQAQIEVNRLSEQSSAAAEYLAICNLRLGC